MAGRVAAVGLVEELRQWLKDALPLWDPGRRRSRRRGWIGAWGAGFSCPLLRRPLGATGATVVDLLGLERTLTALHQHGHQQFFGAGCRAEGVQSRAVGGTTEPVPLCQIAANHPITHEFLQDPNPIRVVRFHPLPPPIPHRIQFLFASSTPPIPRV